MGLLGLASKTLGVACAVDSSEKNLFAWVAQWTFQKGESDAIDGFVQKNAGKFVEILASDYVMDYSPSATVLNGTTYMFYENNGSLYYASCTPGMSSPDTEVPTTTVPSGTPSAVVFNGDLYVFYESVGQLAYSVFNGTSWSSGAVSGTAISESPSAVVYNNDLYVLYQGTANSNGNLCYSVFNGTSSSSGTVSGTSMTESPSAAVYNSDLYVFYQGTGNNKGNLLYNVLSGSTWGSDTQVPNVGMSYSPSAVVFNNDLYVVHQGAADNGQLWYNTFNGTSWAGDKQVSGVTMQDSPCAVVMNNEVWAICSQPNNAGTFVYFSLTSPSTGGMVPAQPNAYGPSVVTYNGLPYLFYMGPGSISQLWYNVCVGASHWSLSLKVPGLSPTGAPPAPVVFNNDVYLFCNSSGNLQYSVFSEGSWTTATVANASLANNPCVVVYNDELYVFYLESGGGTQLCYVTFNGASWSAAMQVPSALLTDSPSAVVYNSQLYVFYQGGSNPGTLWYSFFNGDAWSATLEVPGTDMTVSPSAVAYNGLIYVAHQGSGNNGQLWYNAFNGSSWAGDHQVSGVSMQGSPATVVSGGQPYVFYEGGSGGLYLLSLFSSSSGAQQVPSESGAAYPSALPYGSGLFLFYGVGGESDPQIYYNIYTGNSLWTPPIPGPTLSTAATGANPGLSQSPSAVLFNNQPYVFYNGGGNLWYSTFNGSSWSSAAVTGVGLSESPSAAVYNSQIYVFYQGSGSQSGWLHYTVFNGTTWTTATTEEGGITGSPSAIVFDNDIYVLHQGQAPNTNLWYNVFNGTSWAGDTQVSSVTMQDSPCALVLSSTQLGVCFMASGGSGALEYVVLSGGSWSSVQTIPNAAAGGPPAAVVFDGVGYIVYEGAGSTEGVLMYTMLSDGEWSVPSFVGGVNMGGTASLLVYTPPGYPAAQLFIFHGDASQDGHLWYSQCSPSSGQQNIEVATNDATSGPSATVFNDCLYVFYEGATSGEIKYVTFNGAAWGTEAQVSGAGSSMYGPTGPSAAVFNNKLYLVYQGSSDGTLWYCASSNGSSWGSQVQVIPAGDTSGTWLMSYSPAAVAYGQLYLFYAKTGGGTEPVCYCCSADATSWTAGTVSGASTSASPAAFVAGTVLNLFYTQGGDFYDMYSGNGTSWSAPIEYGPLFLADTPSPVVFNGQLYIFSQMYSNHNETSNWGNNQLWYTTSTGGECSWNLKVNNVYIQESPSAVAFTPSGASSPNLYVFHEGSSSGELWYSTLNGGAWSADVQISGVSNLNSSTSPSALVFNGNLYVFYQGGGGQLYYIVSSNGSSWSVPTQIIPSGYNSGSVFVGNSPSAVVYNSEIYVFFEGPNDNQQIWYVLSSNASTWTLSTVSNVAEDYSPTVSPAAIVYNGDLYVFYQDGGTSSIATGTLCYNRFNGSSWSSSVQPIADGQNPVNDLYANIYGSPGPVVYNGQLYLYFGNLQCTGQLWYAVFNGSSWSAISQVGVQGALAVPSGSNLGQNIGGAITDGQSIFFGITQLTLGFGSPWGYFIKPGPLIP
jgi:hypothetical protein